MHVIKQQSVFKSQMTSLEFSYGILWRLSFLDFHPFRTHFPSPWLTYCRSSDFLTWRNMVDLLLHRQSVLDTEKFWHLLWASLTSCNFSFFFHLYTFSYSRVCFLIKLFAGFLPFFFPPNKCPSHWKIEQNVGLHMWQQKGPTTLCPWLEWQHALGRASSSSCFGWKDPRVPTTVQSQRIRKNLILHDDVVCNF